MTGYQPADGQLYGSSDPYPDVYLLPGTLTSEVSSVAVTEEDSISVTGNSSDVDTEAVCDASTNLSSVTAYQLTPVASPESVYGTVASVKCFR